MKTINLTLGLLLLTATQIFASADTTVLTVSSKSPLQLSMELKSRHTWRGGLTTRSWNVQPTVEYSPISPLLFGAWGCYAVNNDYAEVDLYVTYKFKNFAVTLYDYFNPMPSEDVPNHHFFNFSKEKTGHLFDVALSYHFKSIPLKFLASTIIGGNDLNEKKQNRFSTYVEASYEQTLTSKQHLRYFIGGTTHEGIYYSYANVVNLGFEVTQPITISSTYTVPVKGALIMNPARGNIYLVVSAVLF